MQTLKLNNFKAYQIYITFQKTIIRGDFKIMVNLKLQVLGGNPKLKKKALAKITQIEEKNFVGHLASKNSE